MHAVARIMLDGVIHNVQVSWVKMGVRACQTILNGGANDFGGTLMEETISRMAGAEWGIRMEASEISDAITSIGRIPVERSTTYEPLQRKGLTHVSNDARGDHRAARRAESSSNGRFRLSD